MDNKQFDQIREALGTLSPDTLQEIITSTHEGTICHHLTKDLPCPGEECPGSGNTQLDRLERFIGPNNNLLPVSFLEVGALAQRSVGRIALNRQHRNYRAGTGWGTGFLVSPSLFVTNNHVISSENFARIVDVDFGYQVDLMRQPLPVDRFQTDPGSFFFTDVERDFTLIRLKPKEGTVPADPATGTGPRRARIVAGAKWGYLQLLGEIDYERGRHVNIIQHPRGRFKEVALQDNTVSGIYTDRIRYTTDTETASSGSPVFNNVWQVIALHQGAGDQDSLGHFVNNQGVRIDSIVKALQQSLSEPDDRRRILSELAL